LQLLPEGDLVKYKVFFHQGDELSLKTRVSRGEAWIDESGLHVKGINEIVIPRSNLLDAKLFRMHGLARVIRLDHKQGRMFLSVVRFMVGQFASVNFFKTGTLHTELKAIAKTNISEAPTN
jgi:hypothetical protein